jgi:hypothetical protein
MQYARRPPVAKVIPLSRRVDRVGRGSLAGQLAMAADWDSPEVNESIARDFRSSTAIRSIGCSSPKLR